MHLTLSVAIIGLVVALGGSSHCGPEGLVTANPYAGCLGRLLYEPVLDVYFSGLGPMSWVQCSLWGSPDGQPILLPPEQVQQLN
ncbi:transmembrane protein 168 [Lates japonicus]|uniref:Transmembrane protein 168 n=1 Tax=Lates japonicus TaxID=270547 RepID=A0AAD3NL37_LATJO|nr:transmembrane protein 168 [Lates japonicus]